MVLDLYNSPLSDTVGSDLRKVCSPHGAALHGYQGSRKSCRGDMAGNWGFWTEPLFLDTI